MVYVRNHKSEYSLGYRQFFFFRNTIAQIIDQDIGKIHKDFGLGETTTNMTNTLIACWEQKTPI